MLTDFHIPLTEWPFSSSKTKQYHLAWSPSGFLGVATGKIITILFPNKNKFDQILSFNPFNSPITTISWSNGTDSTGKTPLYLFASSESKLNAVYDISQFTIRASFSSDDSIILTSAWSPFIGDEFYLGDTNGNFICYTITNQELRLNWKCNIGFPADFLSFSPFSNNVVVASKSGLFRVLDTTLQGTQISDGQFPVDKHSINDCRFYPFLDDTLLFVLTNGVFIYPLKDNALVAIIEADAQHESIINIAFDGSDESVFALIHPQFAQEYQVQSTGFIKHGLTNFLSSKVQLNGVYLTHSMYKNKLAIMTKGLFIQLYECKNHRFVSTLIYSSICEKPLDFDIFSGSMVFGLKSGYISVSEGTQMTKFFWLLKGRIYKVAWISDTSFVALGREHNGNQRAFFVDLSLISVTSLLKSSLETFDPNPIELSLSINHIYFSLNLGQTLILLFKGNEQFGSISEEPHTCVTFSDSKENELWSVSSKWVGKRYILDHTSQTEPFSVSRILPFNTNLFAYQHSEPEKIIAVNGFLVAAMKSGDILIMDWYGLPSKYLPTHLKQIVSMERQSNILCVIDAKNNSALIGLQPVSKNKLKLLQLIKNSAEDQNENEFRIIKSFDHSAKTFKWLSKSTALIRQPDSETLTFINVSDFSPLFVSRTLPIDSTADFLKRVGTKASINKCVSTADECGLGLLGTLFQSLLPTPFSPFCPCANFTIDRIYNFLYVINGMFSRSQRDLLRIRKARLEMLLNHTDNAKELLLDTPKTAKSFPIDVMKAGLINSKNEKNNLMQSVISCLINAGKDDDAVDILIFTCQFKEAAKVLISMGETESVLEILSIRLRNDPEAYQKVINSLIQQLTSKKFFVQAAAILIANKEFQKAADVLREAQLNCLAEIIQNIKIYGDSILFDI